MSNRRIYSGFESIRHLLRVLPLLLVIGGAPIHLATDVTLWWRLCWSMDAFAHFIYLRLPLAR
jgi:hypothetical protein